MSVSRGTRFRIFVRDGFRCRYCGRGAPDVVLEVDHVHPVSKGGTDDDANLVTACFDCNRGKYTRRLASGAPNPAGAVQLETVAHPDACRSCRPHHYCAAIAEEPTERGGVCAFYQCRCGRTWRTFWGVGATRIPRGELAMLVKELNDGAIAAHEYLLAQCPSR